MCCSDRTSPAFGISRTKTASNEIRSTDFVPADVNVEIDFGPLKSVYGTETNALAGGRGRSAVAERAAGAGR